MLIRNFFVSLVFVFSSWAMAADDGVAEEMNYRFLEFISTMDHDTDITSFADGLNVQVLQFLGEEVLHLLSNATVAKQKFDAINVTFYVPENYYVIDLGDRNKADFFKDTILRSALGRTMHDGSDEVCCVEQNSVVTTPKPEIGASNAVLSIKELVRLYKWIESERYKEVQRLREAGVC